MRRPRLSGLRARLLLGTLLCSLVTVSALVAAFNLVLDARLHGAVNNLLRDRAAGQLRTLSVVDGRLNVPETPDQGALDTQTWVFAGSRALEQPATSSENLHAALALAGSGQRFLTVDGTHTRFYSVPIVQESHRLGTLVAATSLGSYENSAQTELLGSIILGAITVLGVGALSVWVINRALAPVARMTTAAADWTEHDLSRRFLAGDPHDELSELAATFDKLLDRLSQSLSRERRFTAEISHELRTPLAKILVEVELASADGDVPERYRRVLESIGSSARSLGGVLDALLATARAHSVSAPRSCDARAVAEHAAQSVRSVAAERGVSVEVQRSGLSARVAAETDLLERALTPIIENAIRFARRRVDITIRADTTHVIFEVKDDGPGVDPTLRERIFEPGVSHGGNGAASGAGLGLPLARRLVHAAEGEIDCVPTDQGAIFALRLPTG